MYTNKRRPNYRSDRGKGLSWARKCAASLLAVILVVTAAPLIEPVGHARAASAAQGTFTQDQLDGLAYLNEIRAKVGVGPLELDARLNQAAQAHAAYYNRYHFEGLDAHLEKEGTAGFTGETPGDRGQAAGWPNTSVAEVMAFGNSTTRKAIDALLDTAYHREIILDDSFKVVGIGLQDGTAVINPALLTFEESSREAKVYPYDGMEGAPVGFYGNETPNPLDRFDIPYSGGIISASTGVRIASYEASITDSTGREVPFYREFQGRTVFLYPKDVLDGYSVYTVKLDYVLRDESQPRHKTWSFTTGKGRTLKKLSAQYNELVLNPGSKLPLQVIATYNDRSFGTPKTPVTYSSSSPAGLKVSADGTLEGIKAGSYKVTLSAGGVKGTVPVRVFSRLKSKSYPAIQPTAAQDTAGHADQKAIEWALRSGIVSLDAGGRFHPDEFVSEAQFLTMLLRTYNIDDQAYASKKEKYSAEGAYQVAAERNLLLFSKESGQKSLRDKPINRYHAAGLIASADGVNFEFAYAVDYVLIHQYMRGTEGNQNWTFGSKEFITRAQAAEILMNLKSKMPQLVGAPVSITSEEKLPKNLSSPEVYEKPQLGNQTLIADFHADGTLQVEGQFTNRPNQRLEIQVDRPEGEIEEDEILEQIPVQTDSSGRFSVTSSKAYPIDRVNVFLRTEEMTYYLDVQKGKMNAMDYEED
ncbi:hypothetical protein B9G55_17605 [Saccharibacillus sp. O16]|nr:hypothetical protein B9G55_17605 [Saccharibacillus sp. O16]